MGKYESAYEIFNERYRVDFNIKIEYLSASRIASIDDFSMETSPAVKAQNVYLAALSSALASYINIKIRAESKKDYDLSNIDLGGFINAFDKVVDAICADTAEAEKSKNNHVAFAGLPIDRVAERAWNRVARGFNKPLHEIWAERIRKGKLLPEQLREITNPATTVLDGMVGPDNRYNPTANKDLADVVLIKNAMELAINNRSWISYLNPFNWGPFSRETDYLNELKGKLNTYNDNNFPIDNVVPQSYTGNILEGAHTALLAYVENYKNENPDLVRASAPLISPVSLEKEEGTADKTTNMEKQNENKKEDPNLTENKQEEVQGQPNEKTDSDDFTRQSIVVNDTDLISNTDKSEVIEENRASVKESVKT